jgi:CheY-like chemotaxis protein
MGPIDELTILIAEDDDGHALLVEKNLRRSGLINPMIRFDNGQAALDFLFKRGAGPKIVDGAAYILLLDIRMPQVDGVEVLRKIKAAPELRKLPVIMITTTDDAREVDRCHEAGCNSYLVKPVDYPKFCEAIAQLGLYMRLVQVPQLGPPK